MGNQKHLSVSKWNQPGMIQALFLFFAFTALVIGLFLSLGSLPSSEVMWLYIGLMVASACNVFFSYRKNIAGFFVATALFYGVAGVYFFYSNWDGYYHLLTDEARGMNIWMCLFMGFSFALNLFFIKRTKHHTMNYKLFSMIDVLMLGYAVVHGIVPHISRVGILTSGAMMPGAAAVSVVLVSICGFIYRVNDGVNFENCTFPEYVRYIMKGYRRSAFAKQTKIRKKDVYDKSGSSEASKGNFGEYDAFYALENYLPGKKRYLFGTVIPEADGGFQEVDILCFWRNRIIAVEAKNYAGTLYIDRDKNQWRKVINGEEEYVGNAFVQNWQHCLALSSFLNKNDLYRDDIIIPLTYFTRKLTGVQNMSGMHDVRYHNVPNQYAFIFEMRERAAEWMKSLKNSTSTVDDVNRAYNLLNALPKYNKAELSRKVSERSESGYYRSQTSRERVYGYSEKSNTLYRISSLYVEVMRGDTGSRTWKYHCDMSDSMPIDSDLIYDKNKAEYYFGRMVSKQNHSSGNNSGVTFIIDGKSVSEEEAMSYATNRQ